MNRATLQKIADRLEQSPHFKSGYKGRTGQHQTTYGKRRAFIAEFMYSSFGGTAIPIEDRDQLRRYFDAKYGVTQVEENKYAHIPSVWEERQVNEYACKLHEAAITLENDARFDADYKALAPGKHAGQRRDLIALALRRLQVQTPHSAFYEQLRRYFDDTMKVPETKSGLDTASYARDPTIEFWLDKVRYPEDCARHALKEVQAHVDKAAIHLQRVEDALPLHVPGCPVPIPSPEYHAQWLISQPKETTMSKPITIETKTFVNGADVANMADGEVYSLIAAEEAKIKELEAINAKPKRLVAEIAKRQAGIAALVAHLDSKEQA